MNDDKVMGGCCMDAGWGVGHVLVFGFKYRGYADRDAIGYVDGRGGECVST